jgi:general transcription factor 3C polypeptide 6
VFLSLSDASPKSAPAKGKKAKQASNSKEAPAPAPSKEVKHLASVQKILRFRSIDENHQEHRTYQHEGKEF